MPVGSVRCAFLRVTFIVKLGRMKIEKLGIRFMQMMLPCRDNAAMLTSDAATGVLVECLPSQTLSVRTKVLTYLQPYKLVHSFKINAPLLKKCLLSLEIQSNSLKSKDGIQFLVHALLNLLQEMELLDFHFTHLLQPTK